MKWQYSAQVYLLGLGRFGVTHVLGRRKWEGLGTTGNRSCHRASSRALNISNLGDVGCYFRCWGIFEVCRSWWRPQ